MNAMLQADYAGVQCSGWLLLRRALHSPQAQDRLRGMAVFGRGTGLGLGLGAEVRQRP
jgi:hypothetical protein